MSGLPDGVRIRRPGPDDTTALVHLRADCWDDAYTGLMTQEVLVAERARIGERETRWREILEGDHGMLVAETDDGLIGFAASGPSHAGDLDPDLDLQLYALYVRKAWWGTGVGHTLINEAVGERPAYLWVLANNERAIAFYERQGFRRNGVTDLHLEGLHALMVRP
jgi:ribosomal protein S18 acetylase RimI-like enzyme